MSPTPKKRTPARPRKSGRAPARPANRKKARSRPRPVRAHPSAGEHHPLGMGVADGFALSRLKVPARLGRRPKQAVREIGWAAFGDVARGLAARIGESYLPDVVVGIAKGGVFVGAALATALGAEFEPVRVEKRRRDAPTVEAAAQLPDLRGKRALVVDDVASTGATLARARALTRKAGARDVKTAVLVVRPGGARPDYSALETDELVLFGWDYQLDDGSGAGDPGEVGV